MKKIFKCSYEFDTEEEFYTMSISIGLGQMTPKEALDERIDFLLCEDEYIIAGLMMENYEEILKDFMKWLKENEVIYIEKEIENE